jgi:hypothetical protein
MVRLALGLGLSAAGVHMRRAARALVHWDAGVRCARQPDGQSVPGRSCCTERMLSWRGIEALLVSRFVRLSGMRPRAPAPTQPRGFPRMPELCGRVLWSVSPAYVLKHVWHMPSILQRCQPNNGLSSTAQPKPLPPPAGGAARPGAARPCFWPAGAALVDAWRASSMRSCGPGGAQRSSAHSVM